LVIKHHEAVEGTPEKFHYAVDRVFENGGVSYKRIVDAPAIPAKEAFDETEDILVFVPYTDEQLKEKRACEIRKRMEQLSQDFIQHWAGAQISDIEERKVEFATLHNELRSIMGKEPRLYY
jgi:hypothetical protein